jgi:H+/Cl- antiporter ClcA
MLMSIVLAAEQAAETAAETVQEAAANGGDLLPEALEFLNWGWWVVHLVGIPLVFLIGMSVGKKGKAQ